jgi:hypothetical protein
MRDLQLASTTPEPTNRPHWPDSGQPAQAGRQAYQEQVMGRSMVSSAVSR